MPSSRYTEDTIALPAHLVTRCRAAIGGYFRVVTFRSGGPYSKTEAELGPILAEECRVALTKHWAQSRSIRVYIKGSRGHGRLARSERAAISYLSNLGHQPQAIADVLGVNVETVRSCPAYVADVLPVVPQFEHHAPGASVLKKRLGKAHPHKSLNELAERLGVTSAEVTLRARAAGAAYSALKSASA
jgi:hypothetical protein